MAPRSTALLPLLSPVVAVEGYSVYVAMLVVVIKVVQIPHFVDAYNFLTVER
jgi:hypothetical protein